MISISAAMTCIRETSKKFVCTKQRKKLKNRAAKTSAKGMKRLTRPLRLAAATSPPAGFEMTSKFTLSLLITPALFGHSPRKQDTAFRTPHSAFRTLHILSVILLHIIGGGMMNDRAPINR
jgi:hypothetical protein